MSNYSCLICNGDRLRRTYHKGALALACCADCSFIQQDPLPEPDALSAQYLEEDHYMQEILETENAYLQRDRKALEEAAALGGAGPLLDVGAGAGTLLRATLDRGWEATGLEISRPSAEHLRKTLKVPVLEEPLEAANLPGDSFGVVAFSHSLEHVLDPIGTLRCAAKILRRGGMAYISVPNWKAAKRVATGLRVSWIYEHHISYFQRETLDRALRTAGFAPVRWRFGPFIGDDYPFVIALFQTLGVEKGIKKFLRMGDRPLHDLIADDVNIQCPPWRFRAVFRLARAIIRIWPERFLGLLGRSEELSVFAVLQ
ncbi:MAG: class I SAM-dependent methyltransferase [Planctomycetota bacterium]|jgi:SAM-dependent methyltransferase